jgi:predicted pyridoxine 5'-phosphate oxidase superfamily flavin-nucleotide-binding protein
LEGATGERVGSLFAKKFAATYRAPKFSAWGRGGERKIQLGTRNCGALPDRFDTRRLADNVETRVVLTEIPPDHKAFIESRDMFFLSTVDHQGRPTVSYKGGDPGFVRVLDSKTIAFPCYDGNGMFYSMGNLLGNCQLGMLFINLEKPHRLRVQGIASVNDGDPLLKEYAEAQFVVRVTVTEIFREGSVISRAEYEKYMTDIASRES